MVLAKFLAQLLELPTLAPSAEDAMEETCRCAATLATVLNYKTLANNAAQTDCSYTTALSDKYLTQVYDV